MRPEGHTETPWKFGEDGRISDALGRTVADCRYRAKQGEFIVTAVNSHAALQQANEKMRKALEEIANSPHQAYDGNAPYVSEHSSGYALGVADGHRCAANTAKAALAEAGGETE